MSLAEIQDTTLDETAFGGGQGEVGDYIALLKPRVMSLVIFTALVGILIAPGGIHPVLGVVAILCIAVGAGASGALNMWYDADIDAVMSRTRNRPVPAGRVTAREALVFGLTLSAFSVLVLGLAINWLAAGLLAFTIFFYAVIYTMWLKRATPQNIVIGGAAGAFPPMIGWAAVTGDISVESVVLFLIIFMWTPPHFWALSLFKRGDYESARIPMLPVVAGEDATRRQILAYSVLLAPVGVAPALLGFASPVYGAIAAILGVAFVWYAGMVFKEREGDAARKAAVQLFKFSLFYLFLVFALLLGDSMFAALFSGGFA
ncbi:heme o synthase [Stappia sp. ES.058]|uniref:heme o synthase n=1 Tax=Stappia sp. ES.058 TaxID=1881061 RepID=UPI000879CD2E|nr:heme o synthase [Stappia sp. ES.058]SDT91910.1 protoheme IX farnesyltransferase [Stappia sp. ES.058]